MYTFYQNNKLIMNLNKTTILIGENGSGKTTIINKLKKVDKILFKSNTESKNKKNNNEENKVTVFFAGLENVKDDVDSKNAKYKADENFIYKFNEINEQKTEAIQKDLEILKNDAEENLDLLLSQNIISPSIIIKYEVKTNKALTYETYFEFNGRKIDVKNMPSGVRKLIHLFFSTKSNSVGKKLILLDEVDSMLHPSWIKLVINLIKMWIEDNNIYLVLSTHKPETIYQLNEYVESIAKVNKDMDGVNYFDIIGITNEYNNINESYLDLKQYTKLTKDEFNKTLKAKFTPQLARMFFSINEDVLLVEGITDQMFFKNWTDKLVINTFGLDEMGFNLSILKWIKVDYRSISIIFDGDNQLEEEGSKNFKFKKYLKNLNSIKYFHFKKDLERDVFGEKNKVEKRDKFKCLIKNYKTEINKDNFPLLLQFLKN